MNALKGPLVALALLTAAVPTASAQMGGMGSGCIQIRGIGDVWPGMDCMLEPNALGTVRITLQGSIDIVTHDLADWAIVSCWVCEAGSCGTSSIYGPSKTEWPLPAAGSNRSLINWVVPFRFVDYEPGSTVSFPTLTSYYCRLEVESRPRVTGVGIATGPPAVPDVLANHPYARTAQGSTLVVVLQGTLPLP